MYVPLLLRLLLDPRDRIDDLNHADSSAVSALQYICEERHVSGQR